MIVSGRINENLINVILQEIIFFAISKATLEYHWTNIVKFSKHLDIQWRNVTVIGCRGGWNFCFRKKKLTICTKKKIKILAYLSYLIFCKEYYKWMYKQFIMWSLTSSYLNQRLKENILNKTPLFKIKLVADLFRSSLKKCS